MERFPRGTLSPELGAPGGPSRAPVGPESVRMRAASMVERIATAHADAQRPAAQACDLSITCPTCSIAMQPEHAHYRCSVCGYRDSCCF